MIRPPKEQKQPISVVAWAKMSGFLVPKYKSNHNNDYWRRSEEFIREKKNEVALGLFFLALRTYIGERLMYLALYTWVGPGLQPGPGTG